MGASSRPERTCSTRGTTLWLCGSLDPTSLQTTRPTEGENEHDKRSLVADGLPRDRPGGEPGQRGSVLPACARDGGGRSALPRDVEHRVHLVRRNAGESERPVAGAGPLER